MVFLHSHGVGTARAVRIFKTYGADAIQVMTGYRLARDIRHRFQDRRRHRDETRHREDRDGPVRRRLEIPYALTVGLTVKAIAACQRNS